MYRISKTVETATVSRYVAPSSHLSLGLHGSRPMKFYGLYGVYRYPHDVGPLSFCVLFLSWWIKYGQNWLDKTNSKYAEGCFGDSVGAIVLTSIKPSFALLSEFVGSYSAQLLTMCGLLLFDKDGLIACFCCTYLRYYQSVDTT